MLTSTTYIYIYIWYPPGILRFFCQKLTLCLTTHSHQILKPKHITNKKDILHSRRNVCYPFIAGLSFYSRTIVTKARMSQLLLDLFRCISPYSSRTKELEKTQTNLETKQARENQKTKQPREWLVWPHIFVFWFSRGFFGFVTCCCFPRVFGFLPFGVWVSLFREKRPL